MDISTESIDAVLAEDEREATVTIYQKNGDPYTALDGTDSTISFVGAESKRVREQLAKIQKRLLNKGRRKMTPEQIRRNRIDTAAVTVTTWHGWETDGQEAQCTFENVRNLLRPEHILVQLELAVSEHGDFFDAPSVT